MVRQYEDRRVIGRLVAPPSPPVLIPLATDRAEHWCRFRPPTPIGLSTLCSGPATKPSSDMDMWQVVGKRADAGTRTPDPLLTMEVLYRLSYVGAAW
jgi:hypothetical protein